MIKKKIAVFASGSGTNFERLADSKELREIMDIDCVVCDKPGAAVIEKAKARHIDVLAVNPKDYPSKKEYESRILDYVGYCDMIVLAGYMRIVSPHLLSHYKGIIINLHPSLLPAYKGKDAIKQAYDNGEKVMGVSVHYVNEELDGGEVIRQLSLNREDGESLESVTTRMHALEYELLPSVVYELLK